MDRTLEPEVMDSAEEADEYERMDHGSANEDFVERLLRLGASGRMLDLGTGPGHIPLLICERSSDCTVVGVDLAEHMLALADRRVAASPHAARIELQRVDAKGTGYEAESFDTVFSNTILHHIPEPAGFLAEARRLLRPGGCLLIRDLYRPDSPERALELVQQHAPEGTPLQKELFLASLHAALTPGELRVLADGAGLGDAELVIDSDRHMSLQMRATATP